MMMQADRAWVVGQLRERTDRLLRTLLGLQAAVPLPPLDGAIGEVEALALLIEGLEPGTAPSAATPAARGRAAWAGGDG